MKNKKLAIVGAILAVILVVVLVITILPAKPTKEPIEKPINSTISTATVEVEDIEEPDHNTSSGADSDFIEPDESEADKILSENTTNKKEITTDKKDKPKSFEESKKEIENIAEDYLKKHNIDPKTAGETGENCAHCGKKIWNPDKYGLCIPGMPDNYKNSGYCLGTCGITFG